MYSIIREDYTDHFKTEDGLSREDVIARYSTFGINLDKLSEMLDGMRCGQYTLLWADIIIKCGCSIEVWERIS